MAKFVGGDDDMKRLASAGALDVGAEGRNQLTTTGLPTPMTAGARFV